MVRICPISLSAGERSCLTTVIYTFLSLSTLSGAGLLGYAGVVRLQLEDFEAVLGEGVSLHLPILLATAGCICLIIPILGVILINFSRSDSEAKEMSEESLKWLMRNMWRYNSLTIALIVVAATLTIAFVISSQQRDELATRVDQLFRLDFMRRPDVTPSLHLVQIQFSCCGPEGPAAFLQYLPAAEQGRQIFPFSCCNVSAAQCRRHHTTMVACRDVNDTLDSIDYAKCGLNQRGCRSPLISLIRKLTQPLAVAGICLTGLHVSIAILFR